MNSEYNDSHPSLSIEDEEVKQMRPIIQDSKSLNFQFYCSSEDPIASSRSSVGNISIPEETKFEVDQFQTPKFYHNIKHSASKNGVSLFLKSAIIATETTLREQIELLQK